MIRMRLTIGFIISIMGLLLSFKAGLAITAQFEAAPTAGLAPLFVVFESSEKDGGMQFLWKFSDGRKSRLRNPVIRFDEPGEYTVTLSVSDANETVTQRELRVITVYSEDAGAGLAPLTVYRGSHTWWENPWANCIDGGTFGSATTTSAGRDPAWVIFEFADQSEQQIGRLRMMTDTRSGKANHWVKKFRLQVSTHSPFQHDFSTVLAAEKEGGRWEDYEFEPVAARYIKVLVDEPQASYAQIGEIELYHPVPENLDISGSRVTVTSECFAGYADSCVVNIDLATSESESVSRIPVGAIHVVMSGSPYTVKPCFQIANESIYQTSLKTMVPGNRNISVYVFGRHVGDASVFFKTPDYRKAALKLVTGSECLSELTWENLIDGDSAGLDGAVYAGPRWQPAWAIFELAGEEPRTVTQLRFLADTECRYSRTTTSEYRIWLSESGTKKSDFRLVVNKWKENTPWDEINIAPQLAKYLKIELVQPNFNRRLAGELEVLVVPGPIPLAKSSENEVLPTSAQLLPNYPNPFNAGTTISFGLPMAADVQVTIHNVLGQKIAEVLTASLAAGQHEVYWDGFDVNSQVVSSGVYFCRLNGRTSKTEWNRLIKMTLIK